MNCQMMIQNKEGAKYLTDAQWLRLMQIVNDGSPMTLSLPNEEGRSATLLYKGMAYNIYWDGSFDGHPFVS